MRFIVFLALMSFAITPVRSESSFQGMDSNGSWTAGSFNGEKAWGSRKGEVLAVVSEERCRLIYLGKSDASLNLISAPFARKAPDADDASPNWGGHRFWLGPQARWFWPPLSDWEFSAKARVLVVDSTLKLEHPRSSTDYPSLTREYAWEGSRLRCSVRWKDDGRAYYGMHVVAIDLPAQISARLLKSPERPMGFVGVRIDGCDTDKLLPHPALREEQGQLILRNGSTKNAKCGFAVQTLTVLRPEGWALSMHPGPTEGIPVGSSDSGFLTQVWVGKADSSFAELEQLSPYLLGDAQGQCSSTCFLEAKHGSQ